MTYAICMFAYNEAKHIRESVYSVLENIDDAAQQLTVIANGCTDDTVAILHHVAVTEPLLKVVELEIGDKCNAWNEYVHSLAPEADTHFFVDADVRFTDNVFPILHAQLHQTTAHAVAGVPVSGRNQAYYESLVVERSCFFGNLYGLTGSFIQMVRAKQFYMPVGLNWIDSFLTKAVNTDIQFLDHNLHERVTYLLGHGYYFASLSPWRWDDLLLYKNRIARYELGKLQEILLDQIPVSEWPRDMHTINEQIKRKAMIATIAQPMKRILVRQRLNKLLAQGPKFTMEDAVCAE